LLLLFLPSFFYLPFLLFFLLLHFFLLISPPPHQVEDFLREKKENLILVEALKERGDFLLRFGRLEDACAVWQDAVDVLFNRVQVKCSVCLLHFLLFLCLLCFLLLLFCFL
jgi:hypothetical protein